MDRLSLQSQYFTLTNNPQTVFCFLFFLKRSLFQFSLKSLLHFCLLFFSLSQHSIVWYNLTPAYSFYLCSFRPNFSFFLHLNMIIVTNSQVVSSLSRCMKRWLMTSTCCLFVGNRNIKAPGVFTKKPQNIPTQSSLTLVVLNTLLALVNHFEAKKQMNLTPPNITGFLYLF